MREHYPRDGPGLARDARGALGDAVAIVGVEVARVWRLYLAGAALAFEENRMGVDQILAVRPPGAVRAGDQAGGRAPGGDR